MRRVTLVGQAPGRLGESLPAFGGRAERLLSFLSGMPPGEMRRRVRIVNLLPIWPGKNGKGDAFPIEEARAAAGRMRFSRSGLVVAAGWAVARALNIEAHDFLELVPWRGRNAAVLPHPSGINTWWNDPENRERAAEFLRKAFHA